MAKVNMQAMHAQTNVRAIQREQPRKQANFGSFLFSKDKTKKKKKFKLERKEKHTEGTRDLKFNYTSPNKIFSVILWLVFVFMIFALFISVFATGSTLGGVLTLKKEVAKLEKTTSKLSSRDDFLVFQGQDFLTYLYSVPKTEIEKTVRQNHLTQFLAQGLEIPRMDLGKNSVVERVEFIRQEVAENDIYGKVFSMYYQVTLTAETTQEALTQRKGNNTSEVQTPTRESIGLQVCLPVIEANGEFRVVASPRLSSMGKIIQDKTKIAKVEANALYTKGEKVLDEDKQGMLDFLSKFYVLYAKNDANLNLVTHVSGFISPAEATNIAVKNLVQTGENEYVANGVADIVYKESNTKMNSAFTITFKKQGKGYFVTKVNQ